MAQSAATGSAPAGGAPPPPQSRHRIVEAARKAFAENGFHATTTRHIAAQAGMSPAAVYVHHASKEALLFALSLEGHQETLTELTRVERAATGPVEALRAVMRAFVLRQAAHHTTARIVNHELGALNAEHRREIDMLRSDIQAVTTRVLEAGVASGDFEVPDVAMTASALMGMGIDVSRWYRDDGSWAAEQVADRLADLALRSVRA